MIQDKAAKPTRYYSHEQEKRVATSLGGTNDLQSGGGKWRKNDVELDEWALECKTKIMPSKTISMHKEWFIDAERNRAESLKSYAAVVFSFGDGKDYYAMDERTFKFLLALSNGE